MVAFFHVVGLVDTQLIDPESFRVLKVVAVAQVLQRVTQADGERDSAHNVAIFCADDRNPKWPAAVALYIAERHVLSGSTQRDVSESTSQILPRQTEQVEDPDLTRLKRPVFVLGARAIVIARCSV